MRNRFIFSFLALVFFTCGSAQAADTWLPDFNPNVHVYVDAKLANKADFDQDFESKVQEAAAVHGLSVYVIATEQGDELAGIPKEKWAPEMLHTTLWQKWGYAPGFAENRILVLLYVRARGSDICSTAARSGSYLHSLGIDRNHFYSASGPVMPVVKNQMQSQPRAGLLTILSNVNAEVKTAAANQMSQEDKAVVIFLIIIAVIIVIGIFCFLLRNVRGGGGGSSGGSSCGGAGCGGGCGGGGCGGGG